MSSHYWKMLGRGLLVAAGCGLAFGMPSRADEPIPRGGLAARAPEASAERYLLLTDGRLIRGTISQDETQYVVAQKLGTIRYTRRQVERAFDSVEDAFRYRLERIPEDDPSERLRLARWCMSWHLDKEAKQLLEQVVEISPEHGPARAMLTKIAQSEAVRMAHGDSKVDVGVQKTGGEEVSEDRPGALDSAVLRGAQNRMGINGLPVIFDLPPAMAARRADEFRRFVHPVLQAYCAKCHNEDYAGQFQLYPVKTARQATPDALRTNLDATLRLIDRENPAKSDLLSSTLRLHGVGGKGRPIFSGSNDRAYRILATWVTSLRPPAVADAAPARRSNGSGEAFAADRDRQAADGLEDVARRTQAGDPRQPSPMRGPTAMGEGGRFYRYVEGQGMVPEDPNQVDAREFPLPPMLGGGLPPLPGAPGAKGGAAIPPPRRPRGNPATAASRPPANDPALDPAVSEASIGRSATAGEAEATARPAARKKPVKIDPKILEKLLQKNANRAGE